MLHEGAGQRLLDAMAAEIGACTVMRECIARQRQAFVGRDLDRLNQTTSALELAAQDVSRVAMMRREMLAEIGREHDLATDEFRRVAGRLLTADEARRWEQANKVQQETWQYLRREAQFNGQLLGDALSSARALLRVLTRGVEGSDDAVSLKGLLQTARR